jgi:adenine-specific DNA-methyltransferase
LKSLLPFYAGQVKCIFIDPPYNTKSAFTHYDDNLEHSVWLSMMYPRLELLRELLAEDGSIWITLDDNESHYLKIMLDEIFGRQNFVANVIWQKKHTRANDAKWFSDNHDHILCFAKNKEKWQRNLLERTDEANSSYSNPDNDPRGIWQSLPLQAKSGTDTNFIHTFKNGVSWTPPKGRFSAFSHQTLDEMEDDNRIWFGKDGKNIPRYKKFLSETKDGLVPVTVWLHQEVGHNQDAKSEVKIFNADEVFDTPKPEALLQRILHLSTNENDLVLDSFLGSGTTAAVAHKMHRCYIGIEIGEHAKSHVVPRLKKVIEGEQGGISKAVNWQGGGSFRFCELGETVFDRFGALNPAIRFDDLAAHLWFLETKTPILQKTDKKTPLVGIFHQRAYYLLYNGILGDKRPQGGNVLTKKVLESLPHFNEFTAQGLEIVIYGEACRLGEKALQTSKITFKQIPYDVTDH